MSSGVLNDFFSIQIFEFLGPFSSTNGRNEHKPSRLGLHNFLSSFYAHNLTGMGNQDQREQGF